VINNKLIRRACLAAVAGLLPLSAVAQDKGGDNWSISGWINEALIYYDDGVGSDVVQSSDNGTTLGSRITLAGSTELENTGMSAGFEVILEPLSDATPLIVANQDNFDNSTGAGIDVLGTSGYVSGPFGKLTVGLQSMPTDNIAVLANPSLTLWSSISPVFRGNGFFIQDGENRTGAVWGDFLNCYTAEGLRGAGGIGIDCNGIYRNGVRYDLPTFIEPLSIAVGYANDDVYDIAAKFKTDLGRMQALLYLGYAENHGVNGQFYDSATNFQLQAGLMDPVTGIFGTIAYQNETADFTDAIVADAVPMDAANPTNAESRALATVNNIEDNTNAFWIKVGVKRAFTSIGDTALTFQYGLHNDQFGQNQAIDGVNGSEVQRIGFSIDQYFGSRLIVYAAYENLDLDVDVLTDSPADMNNTYDDADALDLFTLGMTFFF
jgi:hypothetical protein